MSKGSKRKSYRQVQRDFAHVFGDLKPVKPIKKSEALIKPWLIMSGDEIDRVYPFMGTADKNRLKKEAAGFRVKITLATNPLDDAKSEIWEMAETKARELNVKAIHHDELVWLISNDDGRKFGGPFESVADAMYSLIYHDLED